MTTVTARNTISLFGRVLDFQKFTDRFWSNVDDCSDTDACWSWNGYVNAKGYGSIRLQRDHIVAHRAAFELMISAIPEGLVLDHLCRNRSCVNPLHLDPVTSGENTYRGFAPASLNLRKETCLRGHSLMNGDVRIERNTGRRHCRACRRERNAERIAA